MKEICGNCKYYVRSFDGHCNSEFCCSNENGSEYNVPVFSDDTCDDWRLDE